MNNFDFVTSLTKAAGRFLAEHGFQLFYEARYFGETNNGIVVFTCDTCKLRLTLHRDEVEAYIGPLSAPTPGCPDSPQQWFNLSTVVPFLTARQQDWRYDYVHDERDSAKSVAKQIAALITPLGQHWRNISEAFSRETFPQIQPGLIAFEAERQKRSLEQAEDPTPPIR